MDDKGYELRTAVDDRDDGVFATRSFAAGETVMVGFLLKDVTEKRLARHAGRS